MSGDTTEIVDGTSRTVTQAQHIQSSMQQTVTLNQVGRLGLELGLDAGFTNVVGASLAFIQGKVIETPSGAVIDMKKVFENVRVTVADSLARYGVNEIGGSIGLSPILSNILGVPLSSAFAAQFAPPVQYTGQIKLEGQSEVVISDTRYRDERTGQIVLIPTQSAPERTFWQNAVSFFRTNFSDMIQAGINAYYASQVTPINIGQPNPSPVTTTEAPLPNRATPETYKDIFTQETKSGYRINSSASSYSVYDRQSGALVKRVSNGVTEEGQFERILVKKVDGSIGYEYSDLSRGDIYYEPSNQGKAVFKISDNSVQEIYLEGSSPDIVLSPGATQDPQTHKVLNGTVNFNLLGLVVVVAEGKVSKDGQGSGLSSEELNKRLTTAFIFGNGFNNKEVPEGTPDELIPAYMDDLRSEGLINRLREFLVPMFEVTNIFGNAATWGADIVLRIQDKDFFRNLLRGEVAVWVPEPLRSWLDKGIQIKLVQKVIDQLDALQKTQGSISDGIAFAHSGFFAPFLVAMQQKNYDVSTIINYEGPFVDWNAKIHNTHLKRVINVWGTAGLFEGDLGPPLLDPANFQGIDNVNIEIKGAFHNDFSYNSNDYKDRTNWGEKETKREFINRQTNLFMRRMYEAALTDQTTAGRLELFLRRNATFNLSRKVWEVDPESLEL